jgi:hypothetical protein
VELDSAGNTEFADDELRSNYILLGGESNVVLSYYTEHQDVEAGERLFVEYFSDDGVWVELNEIVSDGLDQGVFLYHQHVLPGGAASAYHDEFRFRFRTDVSSTSDDWLIDDISLDCLPPFVCQPGCSDGFACTTGDHCVSNACVGTAVNCSGAGGTCAIAACDPEGSAGNCSMLTPINEGAPCNAGAGVCQAGLCLDPAVTARAFMAAEGEQNLVDGLGPTSMLISPGGTRRVLVWLADNSSAGSLLNGYQLILPTAAQPLAGAAGTVGYVDINPGQPGGNSMAIDFARPDWIFDGEPTLPANFVEAPALNLFGVLYTTIPETGVDPAGLGTRYLAEFTLAASPNASGTFRLAFNMTGSPPFTTLFTPFGSAFQVEQFQALNIVIGPPGGCLNIGDCADTDENNIRDNGCIWWACEAGICEGTAIVFADMGGQFGSCLPDGTADGNDKFHALNCFSNQSTLGAAGYPCEDNPPVAFNVDAGGQFGSCAPDGVCDGNDAFAALNAFTGSTTCSCSGPAPESIGGSGERSGGGPEIVDHADLALVPAADSVRPGDLVEVDVYLQTAVQDLRGYQLHLSADGGTAGRLDLIDIAIHEASVFSILPSRGATSDERPATTLSSRSAGRATSDERRATIAERRATSDERLLGPSWSAFNTSTHQMLAGLDGPGAAAPAGSYLATFTYRASRDAAGTFVVDVRYGDAAGVDRTFLFPTPANAAIAIDAVRPALITISPAERSRSRK